MLSCLARHVRSITRVCEHEKLAPSVERWLADPTRGLAGRSPFLSEARAVWRAIVPVERWTRQHHPVPAQPRTKEGCYLFDAGYQALDLVCQNSSALHNFALVP